uniref:Sulfotransferase family protein n=1 Tax=Candidatus Kentrum sp. LPFa TaxID=2126335 RepID=A0A450WTR8_9GAMM|nr:MAG: Sulfotransferase family protein [Candidatus Kentron sp. LPFa]VFK34210.1 MAG: Sulfotransferase family protein [Candidatus Kentron sp. LPFa]
MPPRYVDDTPWYGALIPFMHKVFPDAHFVHIIRNGRYVLQSLRASLGAGYTWISPNIQEQAELWSNQVKLTRERARLHLPKNQYTEIRYEALSSEPIPTINYILDAVGLPQCEEVFAPLATPMLLHPVRIRCLRKNSRMVRTTLPPGTWMLYPRTGSNRKKNSSSGLLGIWWLNWDTYDDIDTGRARRALPLIQALCPLDRRLILNGSTGKPKRSVSWEAVNFSCYKKSDSSRCPNHE